VGQALKNQLLHPALEGRPRMARGALI